MTVSLTIEFNDAAIKSHLTSLAALDASGYDGMRREVGEYLLGDVQDNLDAQKLFDGRAMPQSKAARRRRGKTLIDRHHLYDSYVYQLRPGGVEVGSASVYAAVHHYGGKSVRHSKRGPVPPLPARPVLGIGPRQERKLGDIFIADIKRTWGHA